MGGSIRVPALQRYLWLTEHLLSFHGAKPPGIDQIIPKFTTARHVAVLGPMARIEDLHHFASDPNSVQTVDGFFRTKTATKPEGLPGQIICLEKWLAKRLIRFQKTTPQF